MGHFLVDKECISVKCDTLTVMGSSNRGQNLNNSHISKNKIQTCSPKQNYHYISRIEHLHLLTLKMNWSLRRYLQKKLL